MIPIRPTPIRRAKAGGRPRIKPSPGALARLRVGALPGRPARGRLLAGALVIDCALGPAGIVRRKREGDGATPAGAFPLLFGLVRRDRVGHPSSQLPLRLLSADDGWCDDSRCASYNRPVRRPFVGSHERLWRDDGLYDCIVVPDYNVTAARRGRGSAIFLHVAAPGYAPTAGCVALARGDLLRLMPRIGRRTRLIIA